MKITEVLAEAQDLKQLADFYANQLGLVTHCTERELQITLGATSLRFVQGGAHRYHFAFNIPHNQLEEAAAWLSVPLLQDKQGAQRFQFEVWRAESLYFLDPAGNILELIARHPLDNASVRPFGPHSLLCVSEVGVACDSVRELAAQLQEPFFHDSGSELFVAAGDDEGLIVFVKTGREWYPDTGVQALPTPLRVRMEGGKTLRSPAGIANRPPPQARPQMLQIENVKGNWPPKGN